MLRRRYTSIAEEPEAEEDSGDSGPTLRKIDETLNLGEQPTKINRLPTLGGAAAVDEEDLRHERLLHFRDEDVFSEEEDTLDGYSTKGGANRDDKVSETTSDQGLANEMGLSANQVREIKEAFHVFDVNGDGCISATELKKLVTSLGYNITEAELMDMMNQIDSDGNGAIDFPEFLALMTKNLQETDAEDMTMESFKVFDRDNSGFIGASELHRVFKILGQDFQDYEIEAMIKAADTDGDGLVGYDDFIKMMNLGEN